MSIRSAERANRDARRERVVNETFERIDHCLSDISPELAMAVCRKAWRKSQSRFITNLQRQFTREREYEEQQDRLRCAVACADESGAREQAAATASDHAAGER